jgi:hypothetical protein
MAHGWDCSIERSNTRRILSLLTGNVDQPQVKVGAVPVWVPVDQPAKDGLGFSRWAAGSSSWNCKAIWRDRRQGRPAPDVVGVLA